MTTPSERLDELLVDEATDSLTDAAREELETLLAEHPNADRYGFERAASAVFLAVAGSGAEQVPAALGSRLAAQAEQALDSKPWPRSS